MKLALGCVIAAALVATALSAPIPTLADDEPPAFLDDESDVLLVDEESGCPADTYKDGTSGSCKSCGGGTSRAGSTKSVQCRCPANTYWHYYWQDKAVACIKCPKYSKYEMISDAGSTRESDCKCPANWYKDATSGFCRKK